MHIICPVAVGASLSFHCKAGINNPVCPSEQTRSEATPNLLQDGSWSDSNRR